MPNDFIDNMIENLGGATRVPTTAGSDDLSDFSLTPKPEAETKPGTLDAARAVREAVLNNTGRRKHMKTWAAVAREALGLGRLSAKRYNEVLETGYAAGLFRLDEDSLSYPVLVALDPEPEAPMVEEEPPTNERQRTPYVDDTPLPEDWDPPTHLPCGHWNRQTIPNPEAEPVKDHQVPRTLSVKVGQPGPEHCPDCAAGKPGDPRYQEEGWQTPVPERMRRTKEKSDPSYPGYPGLCTDPETGFYIGGLGNDCSRYHKGKARCEYHATKARPKKRKAKRKASA